MICIVDPAPDPPNWHRGFLAMLPTLVGYIRFAFRYLMPEARQEAVQEATCNAMIAYAALARRGRLAVAHAATLAKFAVAQTRDGRKVGGRLNCKDVSSDYCRRVKGAVVERLDRFDREEGQWIEAVVEDHHTPVLDQVAFRCDFPAWLDRLSRRNQKIAHALAAGHSTGSVAKRFDISPGRISQLRRELHESWQQFLGEAPQSAEDAKAA